MSEQPFAYRAARLLGPIAALLLAACAPLPTTSAPTELPGTSWRLLEFRPAGGGANVLPAAPDQYELRFEADGRLAGKMDCNRGMGAYSVLPAQGGVTRVKLGPVATTRMLCPPSELGPRLPRDIEGERGYRIDGGQLHLDAAGDAGVYVWERVAP